MRERISRWIEWFLPRRLPPDRGGVVSVDKRQADVSLVRTLGLHLTHGPSRIVIEDADRTHTPATPAEAATADSFVLPADRRSD